MSDSKEEVKQLRNILFNMINFTNMYVLILNEAMEIKFANDSLAVDLGFDKYRDLLGLCWLDFIEEKERNMVTTIHTAIANGFENWKEKYGEFQNNIKGKNNKMYFVYWFNSHINSEYNWTFSFGIKKQPTIEKNIDSVRTYYKDIISKDRVMINSIRDVIGMEDKTVGSCKPNFVGDQNDRLPLIHQFSQGF